MGAVIALAFADTDRQVSRVILPDQVGMLRDPLMILECLNHTNTFQALQLLNQQPERLRDGTGKAIQPLGPALVNIGDGFFYAGYDVEEDTGVGSLANCYVGTAGKELYTGGGGPVWIVHPFVRATANRFGISQDEPLKHEGIDGMISVKKAVFAAFRSERLSITYSDWSETHIRHCLKPEYAGEVIAAAMEDQADDDLERCAFFPNVPKQGCQSRVVAVCDQNGILIFIGVPPSPLVQNIMTTVEMFKTNDQILPLDRPFTFDARKILHAGHLADASQAPSRVILTCLYHPQRPFCGT